MDAEGAAIDGGDMAGPTFLKPDGTIHGQLLDQSVRELARRLRLAEDRVAALDSTTNQSMPGADHFQIDGDDPLNVEALLGRLAQPQIPYMSRGTTSPPRTDPQAQDGSLNYNTTTGFVERYNQTTVAGSWDKIAYIGGGTDQTVINGACLILPLSPPINLTINETVAAGNDVHWWRFFNPKGRLAFTKISFRVNVLSVGGLGSIGLYNANGTTRIAHSGAISTTTTGLKNATIAASIDYGEFILAWTFDNTVAAFLAIDTSTNGDAIANDGTAQMGTAGNVSAAGVLPTTLGTLTGAAVNCPICKFN